MLCSVDLRSFAVCFVLAGAAFGCSNPTSEPRPFEPAASSSEALAAPRWFFALQSVPVSEAPIVGAEESVNDAVGIEIFTVNAATGAYDVRAFFCGGGKDPKAQTRWLNGALAYDNTNGMNAIVTSTDGAFHTQLFFSFDGPSSGWHVSGGERASGSKVNWSAPFIAENGRSGLWEDLDHTSGKAHVGLIYGPVVDPQHEGPTVKADARWYRGAAILPISVEQIEPEGGRTIVAGDAIVQSSFPSSIPFVPIHPAPKLAFSP